MTDKEEGLVEREAFAMTPAQIERFWRKVDKTGDCWIWTGRARSGKNYGAMQIASKNMRAHRLAWFLQHGRVPPSSLDVCHKCDTPKCVNPAHLFVGTRTDNMQDAKAKGRTRLVGQGTCKHGHPYTPENTRMTAKGRQCLACAAAANRAWRRRLRGRK